ncbi:MAG: efflux RND transporter permease subunit [Verrucomicrobiota bacterium]
MNLASLTLNNTRTSLVLYLILILAGITTFLSIGRRENPEFTIRTAKVFASYPGRSAVQVEQEVTEVLEQKIRELAEVDEILSTSQSGLSILNVEMSGDYSGTELENLWTDMRDKIDEAILPEGAMVTGVNDDFGETYPYIYGVKGDGYTPKELYDVSEDLRDLVLALDGIGKVSIHGDIQERIYLEYTASKFAAYGFTTDFVAEKLMAQNVAVSSGEADFGNYRLSITTLGEFNSLEELAEFRISTGGNTASVRIADLFDIKREYEDPVDTLSHFNGERVVCVAMSMNDGEVVSKVGAELEDKIHRFQQTLPIGLEIERMFFQPIYVDASVANFFVNLGQAFFFVLLVMLLFSGWRLAVIVGLLVPSVCLFCFALMPTFGVEIETMSIAALIIALGILVDNAVVVCEQILNRLNEGQDRKDAVVNSIKALMVPLLAGSGTTIAAFAVIATAEGNAAEYTYSLFAVVSLSLIGSWLLSMTIIALFCFYFLKPLKKDTFVGRMLEKVYGPYERLLRFTIKLGWVYPILILLLTIAAAAGFSQVPSLFFPPNERGQFIIDFELDRGKSITETEESVVVLEEWLLSEHAENVESVSSWIGEGGPRWYLSLDPEDPDSGYALLSVLTKSDDPEMIQNLVDSVSEFARTNFPAARVLPKALENGPPVGSPIQVRLLGEDMDTLYALRDQIMGEMKSVEGIYDLRDDWGTWVKEVIVDPDPIRAARLSITTSTIADALSEHYEGETVSYYREGEDSIPIVMRSEGDYRDRLERIRDLPIYNSETGVIPISQVADVRIEYLPGAIERKDTVRTMTIEARVRGRYASAALAEIQRLCN